MHNPLVVEVAHALGNLLGDDDHFVHVEFVSPEVQVCVEGVALAQRSDDSQARWLHTGPHEQDQVFMPGFPIR